MLSALGKALTRLRAVPGARRGDEGFVLLETVIAITLSTVVMSALAAFFVNGLGSTSQLRARQAASRIAASEMEELRGLPVSDLLKGRDTASVAAQLDRAAPAVRRTLAATTLASDATAGPGRGATATVSTATARQVVDGVGYGVDVYLGGCRTAPGAGDCDGATLVGPRFLRAVVAVTWPDRHCPSGTCTSLTTTLFSQDEDKTFTLDQAPPPPPVVVDPDARTSTLGGPVDLQLRTVEGTGVPPLTWSVSAGSLPAGLTLSSAGTVTGTPTALRSPTDLTVAVTDAFSRTATRTFSWRVVAAPTVTAPAEQRTTAGTSVTLPITSTCPNSPCRFTLSGAPAGLDIDPATGVVSGRPPTPGTWPGVRVGITDAAGVTATSAAFTWVVTYGPLVVGDPGPQKSTVGTAVDALQLTATGGGGSYTWSAGSLPAGLSVSRGGLVTGTPLVVGTTAASLTVTDAPSGYSATTSFTWTVVARPTVDGPGARSTTVGAAPSVALTWTCPYATCTIAVAGAVPGAGLSATAGVTGENTRSSLTVSDTSGTVHLSGKVAASAVTSGTSALFAPTVTITDGAGAAATPAAGSWRVYLPASISTPGVLKATVGTARSVPLAYTCPYLSCTITLTGAVPGVGLSAVGSTTSNNTVGSMTVSSTSGTVYLAGTVQPAAVPSGVMSQTYAPSVTITDAGGTSATPAPGAWTAYARPSVGSPGALAATVTKAKSIPVAYTCPHSSCSITLTQTMPGIGLSTTSAAGDGTTRSLTVAGSGTVHLTGTVQPAAVPTGTSQAYSPQLTITDADGVAAPSGAGAWTAYTAPTITDPGSQAVEPNQSFTLPVTARCPNGGCTWTAEYRLTSSTTWRTATVSSTGTVSGSFSAGSYVMRVTATDADAVAATTTFALTSQTFSVVVPDQDTPRPNGTDTTTVTIDVSKYVSPAAGAYTYAISGHPSWVTISSAGVITGVVNNKSNPDNTITVTVTSKASAGSSDTYRFRWRVTG